MFDDILVKKVFRYKILPKTAIKNKQSSAIRMVFVQKRTQKYFLFDNGEKDPNA